MGISGPQGMTAPGICGCAVLTDTRTMAAVMRVVGRGLYGSDLFVASHGHSIRFVSGKFEGPVGGLSHFACWAL